MRLDVVHLCGGASDAVFVALDATGVLTEDECPQCGPSGGAIPAADVEEGTVVFTLLRMGRASALRYLGGAARMRAESEHGLLPLVECARDG